MRHRKPADTGVMLEMDEDLSDDEYAEQTLFQYIKLKTKLPIEKYPTNANHGLNWAVSKKCFAVAC